MAKIRSDAHLYLSQTGNDQPTPAALVSVTKADPCVATFASAPAGMVDGSMCVFEGTGDPLLDGKAFRLTDVSGANATLDDFDGTRLAIAVAAGTGTVYNLTEVASSGDGDLLEACMATITVAGQAPDSLNLDDMCSSTVVLGAPKPPTFQFTGWIDNESDGFKNLVQASLESPKTERYMLIDYGDAGGWIFGQVEIGEITVTAGVNAGLSFSGSGVFKELPTYSWAL